YLDSNFPTVLHFTYKYGADFESAILANANCGGENVARGVPKPDWYFLRNYKGEYRLRNQPSSPKALYLAPLKALCQEKAREWSEQFGQLGIVVVELTGDQGASVGRRSSRLAKASIIVSTPEMWDYFMRQASRGSDAMSVVEALQLVCVDEVHMLGMPKRGAILESVVARLRTLRQLTLHEKPLRLVAVSATVPNIADIGAWLSVAPANTKAFGMEHRPVPLRVHVQTFRGSKNEFMFQESLNRELGPIIHRYSEGKATLVFCVTKRACETAATSLRDSRPWQPVPSVRTCLAEKAVGLGFICLHIGSNSL
ncbi:MER3, partial [Symbiodinium sp. KB8]